MDDVCLINVSKEPSISLYTAVSYLGLASKPHVVDVFLRSRYEKTIDHRGSAQGDENGA